MNVSTVATRRVAYCLISTLLFTRLASSVYAADPADAKKPAGEKAATEKAAGDKAAADKAAAKAPNTYTVATEPLTINVELGATVEARDVKEISVDPEYWSELVVEQAAEHGKHVHKGDVLVKFDTKRIDQTLRDAEAEAKLNDLSLKQTREALALLKQSVPLQLAEAQRAARQADEDLKDFLEKAKPRTLQDLEFQTKGNEFYVQYQEEELKQLEKMYKGDDLVEDTEKIVLKRAQYQLEAARHQFKHFQANRDWQLQFGLPRYETNMKNAVTNSKLALQRAEATLPKSLIESELSLAKLEYEDGKKKQRLAELRRDRDRLTVHSPADGVVYYGRATRGSWPGVDQAAAALAVGSPVRPHQVLMSVVDPKTARLRATVEESQLRQLRQGLRGTFRPTIDPKQLLPATLGKIEPAPIAGGRFDADIEAELAPSGKGLPVALMPGMGGQAKFMVYSNPKAVVVPAATVKTDDDDQTYVMLVDDAGNATRRDVKTGEKAKEKIEILDGLKAGDKIQQEEKK